MFAHTLNKNCFIKAREPPYLQKHLGGGKEESQSSVTLQLFNTRFLTGALSALVASIGPMKTHEPHTKVEKIHEPPSSTDPDDVLASSRTWRLPGSYRRSIPSKPLAIAGYRLDVINEDLAQIANNAKNIIMTKPLLVEASASLHIKEKSPNLNPLSKSRGEPEPDSPNPTQILKDSGLNNPPYHK